MIGWMFGQAVKWLAGFVADMLNTVWKLLTATLFHLPDVTGLPQVQDLTAKSLMVVNVSYVLFIMAAGVVSMTHGSIQARHSAGELLPRLCFGLVAANFGTWICQQVIAAGNALVLALVLALTGQGIASQKTLSTMLKNILDEITNPAALLLSVIIGLLIDVLVLLLLVGWIVRFAILIIICGTAPIALACHGLPWTDPVAQLWWKTLGGVIATVVLQAITLHTSLSIWLNPASNLPSIGWPFDPSGVLNLLVVAVLLWVTVRIPGLVKQYVAGSRGRPNVLGMIVRLVIVQQLTRGLGGLARSGFRGTGPRGAPGAGLGPGRGPGRGSGGGPGGGPGRPGSPGSRLPGRGPSRPPALAGGPRRRGGPGGPAGSGGSGGSGGAGQGGGPRGGPGAASAWRGTAPAMSSAAPPGGTAGSGAARSSSARAGSPSPRAGSARAAGSGTGWSDPGRAYRPLVPRGTTTGSGTGWPRPAGGPPSPRPPAAGRSTGRSAGRAGNGGAR